MYHSNRYLALVSIFWLTSSALPVGPVGLAGTGSGVQLDSWLSTLPPAARHSILWSADHEEGDLSDWTYPSFRYAGGGVFNTGGSDVRADACRDVAHAGDWSARATITNALRAENGNRAVRLMRWTDRPWDDHGRYFPNAAYYSTWVYLPFAFDPRKFPPWDPGDGGWWNIFQFKGPDREGTSQPLWVVNVGRRDNDPSMYLYLHSHYNRPSSRGQRDPLPLPVGKWFHLEAFYHSATDRTGRLTLWQDGQQILDLQNVVTSLGGENGRDTHPIWGIGNYTDHIVGDPEEDGRATVYFDDAAVSLRLSLSLRASLSPATHHPRAPVRSHCRSPGWAQAILPPTRPEAWAVARSTQRAYPKAGGADCGLIRTSDDGTLGAVGGDSVPLLSRGGFGGCPPETPAQ